MLLMYETVVVLPPSIKIYPVESISKFESFNLWDDSTCLPIRRSEFRPLIKLSNNMPSACLSIWLGLPGNIITGLLVLFLIS